MKQHKKTNNIAPTHDSFLMFAGSLEYHHRHKY